MDEKNNSSATNSFKKEIRGHHWLAVLDGDDIDSLFISLHIFVRIKNSMRYVKIIRYY